MALIAVTPVCHAGVVFAPGETLPDHGVDRERLLRLGAAREQDEKPGRRRRPAKQAG